MGKRFAWYCLLYGGAAGASGITYAFMIGATLQLAYLYAAALPLGAALLGWRLLQGRLSNDLLVFYILAAVFLTLSAEMLYFDSHPCQQPGLHFVRNLLLDLWLPYLFLLWFRQPLDQTLPLLWRREIGIYLIGWAIISLIFALNHSSPLYMSHYFWVPLTLVLCGLVIVIGIRHWLGRDITGWLAAAGLVSLVFLAFVNLLWIGWLINTAKTARVSLESLPLYLSGGVNDVLYSLAPLILLVFLYWDGLIAVLERAINLGRVPQ
jgi:hypothetical protein